MVFPPFRFIRPISAIGIMDFVNPFKAEGQWFRGNLHCHTTESDGRLSPKDAAEFYRSRGYDFLCITDHGKVTHTEGLSTESFLVFPGVETSPAQSRHHIVGMGLHELGPFEKCETAQETIDRIISLKGLASVAHPYWSALTDADIRPLKSIIGIEVYNGVCEAMIGRGLSTVHWDNLLRDGMPLRGLAVDDAHHYTDDAPAGWVWVKAPSLTEKDIIQALAQGQYYASNGPTVHGVDLATDRIEVESSPVDTITFHSRGPTGNSVHRVGEGILTHATHTFKPEHQYVRVEFVDGGGRRAWCNPVYTELFGT
jgi:hypothetical protein